MNKFFLLLVVGMANLFSVSADPLSLPLKKLDQYIQRQVKQEKVIGCAVAVVSNGKAVFLKAYGVRKKGKKEPTTPETVFQLGSLSKTITASLVALLQKEGRVSLQDSVSKYYSHLLPATQLQHLLNHTSGYSRTGWNQKIEAGQTRNQLLQLLAKCQQDTPGETYDYHNVVYSLLQEVVEKSCQQSFKEALMQRLFHPLRMTRTSVGYDDFDKQQNLIKKIKSSGGIRQRNIPIFITTLCRRLVGLILPLKTWLRFYSSKWEPFQMS
jgi:CubicO group peptidase (beta-lactamase class C family)